MSQPAGFDRTLTDWLVEDGAHDIPARVIDAAIAEARHTRRSRPLPDWITRWVPMETTFPLARPMPNARLALALTLLALALIGASLLAIGAGRLLTTSGVHNGLIAFDSNGDIMVVNPDGTGVRTLITGPAMQVGASWSPDGRHLAYFERVVGDGEYDSATDQFLVHVVDPGGGSDVDITEGVPVTIDPYAGTGVTWSSDSRRLAFAIQEPGSTPSLLRSRIVVADADGSSLQPLALEVDAHDPIWRPGDDLLAFRVPPAAGSTSGVWTVRPDGTDPQQVTSSSVSPNDGYTFTGPAWSPSGTSIVYGYSCCASNHDIWTVDLDRTEHRLTAEPADEYWPSWSSTGRIAFQRQLDPTGPVNDVIVVDADGSNPERVDIETSGGIGVLVWSPDGLEILAGTSYSSELMIASVDGSHPAYKVPTPNSSYFGTAWSWQRAP